MQGSGLGDHADSLQIRFEVSKISGAGTGGIEIYDPIIIGWEA